jgi:transcriptional regulator with XRE-family HTH domain
MKPTTTYIAITGALIARLRREAGLQQTALGATAGVNQSSWSKIERGATVITLEHLAMLGSTLGVEPGAILTQVDRVVRFAEQQGLTVLRNHQELVGEMRLAQLSGQALAALVDAALTQA